MQRHKVIGPRKTFPPTPQPEAPRSEALQEGVLELRAKTRGRRAASPIPPGGASLKAVTPHELRMLVRDVAKARHVDAIRTVPEGLAVFHAGERAVGAGAEWMIHEVAPELTARVCKSGRKTRGFRVEQDTRTLESRGAQEDHP